MYVLASNQTVKKFPYSISDLKQDNPRTSFPDNISPAVLASYNVFPVVSTTPQYNPITQNAVQIGCVFSGTQWETEWLVTDKTAEELQAETIQFMRMIVEQTQVRLDQFANTRNYGGILSACTYATSSVPKFRAEGQYCVAARDLTWSALYTLLAEVEAGTRPKPGRYSDVEPLLPELVWPI